MSLPLAAIAFAAPKGILEQTKDWLLDKHSSYLDLMIVAILVTLGLALSQRRAAGDLEVKD